MWSHVIDLPDCSAYLHFATSEQQCSFELANTGLGTPTRLPATGTYDDGLAGSSPYQLRILRDTAGGFTGALELSSAKGAWAVAFDFSAMVVGEVATLLPVPQAPGDSGADHIPSQITVTLGNGSLSLGECPYYLSKVQNMAQCTFTASSSA
jgi:hypothetical protein